MAEIPTEMLEQLAASGWLGRRGFRAPPAPQGDMYSPPGRKKGSRRSPPVDTYRMTPEEIAAFEEELAFRRVSSKAVSAGAAAPLEKAAAKMGALSWGAKAGRVVGPALKYGGAIGTAAWLGSELYDLLVEEPKLERAANAEQAMALTGDTEYLQGTHDKSFAALVDAGDDIARGGARAQLEQQMRQEDELRGAMAPWRAEMAAQAVVSKPSLPELLAKMGIDPYQGR